MCLIFFCVEASMFFVAPGVYIQPVEDLKEGHFNSLYVIVSGVLYDTPFISKQCGIPREVS